MPSLGIVSALLCPTPPLPSLLPPLPYLTCTLRHARHAKRIALGYLRCCPLVLPSKKVGGPVQKSLCQNSILEALYPNPNRSFLTSEAESPKSLGIQALYTQTVRSPASLHSRASQCAKNPSSVLGWLEEDWGMNITIILGSRV